jgi:ATP-dependent Clp protease protease subunit
MTCDTCTSSEPDKNDNVVTLSPQQVFDNAMALSTDKIFVVGEICEELAVQVCRQILVVNEKNNMLGTLDPIHMFINSPGGDLYSAWMICDIMDIVECPVITYGFGTVASAGIAIFMNGDYGMRYATKNTQFMSHTFSMVSGGKHADMLSHNAEIHRMHTRMVDHYTKCTGLAKNEIHAKLLMEHDVWLNVNDAKRLNIVDQIIPVRKNHYMDYIKYKEKLEKCQTKKKSQKSKTQTS